MPGTEPPSAAVAEPPALRGRPALWHPFAAMDAIAGQEVMLERGDGVWVFDEEGKRYLDASGALWYCNVGHGRDELARAAKAQMEKLACYQIFDVMANRPALELAERLQALAPTGPDSSVFFTSGGSDSVDTAAKIARRYWQVQGRSERQLIINREGAYHGVNGFGTSLSGIEANASGWGRLVNGVVTVPRDDLGALEHALERHRGEVAAFISEPAQGAAGVYPPPPEYWSGAQDLCRAEDVLVIADEVVTGFGRVGRWFGSERYGIEPDLVTCAKGLSSGYLPVGAVLASDRVLEVVWSPEAGAFRHGYTYSGHPAACAVALANLGIIEREQLVERVAANEDDFAATLEPLAEHALVETVRTAGFLCGVEIRAGAGQAEATRRLVVDARRRGVLVRNLLGRTLQISPPLTIDQDELDFLAETLAASLDAVDSELEADG
ncbi:MAG TPA: aspartate aminotransferase family protein [Solirubrobacterales bacterium]